MAGLISSGIEDVMVFELPGGIRGDGGVAAAPGTAVVKWKSSWSDKFHQVYVNGRYAGSTVDVEQRQMVIQIPTLLERPVRMEVFAVEPQYFNADFGSELDRPKGQSGRVKLSLLRSQNLPAGATIQVYSDGGTGQIDYESCVNSFAVRLWPAWQDKAGFGMSKFGVSDFGYDSAGAVGFGRGSFGHGQFGLDADRLEWISEPLDSGAYRFAVKVIDEAGNESSGSETGQIVVVPAAEPAERLSVYSFDEQTNQLILNIS